MIPESFKTKRDEAAEKYYSGVGYDDPYPIENYCSGADFGYLEGREAMAKEIVEWFLSYDAKFILRDYIVENVGTPGTTFWAEEIKRRFLKKE